MINRREAFAGAIIAGAFLSSPTAACKSPGPKDRRGYTGTIDAFLAAWWARDFDGFLKPFRDPDADQPLPGRGLFDAHYTERVVRFRGDLLFNGASAVVQVVTPQQPDFKKGICGGHANSDLFLVKFYPGLANPVIESVKFLAKDLLAQTEWEQLPGAPDVKIENYWQLKIKPEEK